MRRTWWSRSGAVARLGARVGGNYASTAARKVFASAERRTELDRRREMKTAQQVADELGQMKGALMKLGQMASYLDEGLPEHLRAALAQLQSDAPPMAPELAAQVIEAELGRPPDELFIEWDPIPIAAASIGQVHRAIAIDPATGQERPVAVKVQYPGVDAAIDADLKNADLLGTVLKQGFSGLDPAEMVDEIKLRLVEELDYRIEARNQAAFANFYRGHPFIRVPRVIRGLSSQRVITSELVNGARWADILQRDQAERDRIAEILFRFVFRSLYRMRAFNADPHPGNYIFADDGTVWFLDFGLVRYFNDTEMDAFTRMVKAAAHDDDPVAYRTVLEETGMLTPGAPVETGDVAEYFFNFYEPVRANRDITWSPSYSSQIIRHTFDRSSPISQYATVPRAFVFIQRINLGLYALLGELGARGNYRRIAEELWPFTDAEPSTALGEAEAAWLKGRDPLVGRQH